MPDQPDKEEASTVLVADDEVTVRSLVTAVLRRRGYDVNSHRLFGNFQENVFTAAGGLRRTGRHIAVLNIQSLLNREFFPIGA
jgi:CheY-like chemotaxis protein